MYEIFSDRETQDLQRSNHQRRHIAVKGGYILKSNSNNIIKKEVLADLGNIIKQKTEDQSLIKDDNQITKQSVCDERNNSIDTKTVTNRHQRLFQKITDQKNVLPGASHEVPDYLLETPYFCSENIIFDDSSNSTFGENSRIEEDVFFGTYSVSEDERELISMTNWDVDIPESMSGYCSEGGSCDESYDDRWLEKPLWKTSEELHQIVGVPETSKCETLTKLEDIEFTSLFSDMPCAVKTTLDVPDVLFGCEYENDASKTPVPDLEW